MIRKSLISGIKKAYSKYKDSVINYYSKTWISDDGNLALLNGAEEQLILMKEAERLYIEAVENLKAFDINPTNWIEERYGAING